MLMAPKANIGPCSQRMWETCSGTQAGPSRNGVQSRPCPGIRREKAVVTPSTGDSYRLAQAAALRGAQEPVPTGYSKPHDPPLPRTEQASREAPQGPQGQSVTLASQVEHSSWVLSTLLPGDRRGSPLLSTCFGAPTRSSLGQWSCLPPPHPPVCYICTPCGASPVWRRKGTGSAGACWPPWAARCLQTLHVLPHLPRARALLSCSWRSEC